MRCVMPDGKERTLLGTVRAGSRIWDSESGSWLVCLWVRDDGAAVTRWATAEQAPALKVIPLPLPLAARALAVA